MGPDEASRLAGYLSGLFPSTPPTLAEYLAKQFEPYFADAVRTAIDAHRARYTEPNPPALIQSVREEHARREPPRPRMDDGRRVANQSIAEMQAAIARLSQREFERHLKALYEQQPWLPAFLKGSDPRTSTAVQSLIWERIKARSDKPRAA